MRDACPFCDPMPERELDASPLVRCLWGCPVTLLHALVGTRSVAGVLEESAGFVRRHLVLVVGFAVQRRLYGERSLSRGAFLLLAGPTAAATPLVSGALRSLLC